MAGRAEKKLIEVPASRNGTKIKSMSLVKGVSVNRRV
jgi:hypothetical protein